MIITLEEIHQKMNKIIELEAKLPDTTDISLLIFSIYCSLRIGTILNIMDSVLNSVEKIFYNISQDIKEKNINPLYELYDSILDILLIIINFVYDNNNSIVSVKKYIQYMDLCFILYSLCTQLTKYKLLINNENLFYNEYIKNEGILLTRVFSLHAYSNMDNYLCFHEYYKNYKEKSIDNFKKYVKYKTDYYRNYTLIEDNGYMYIM